MSESSKRSLSRTLKVLQMFLTKWQFETASDSFFSIC